MATGRVKMNQSTIIFGYLAVAFLIFITQRGELPIYWGFLVSAPTTPASGPTATGSGALTGGSVASTAASISSLADTLAVF
jgi:hypothetical protein